LLKAKLRKLRGWSKFNQSPCTVNTVKCANCVVSNKKYGLNVDVEHVAWDVNKCESYKRIEQYQRSKYIR